MPNIGGSELAIIFVVLALIALWLWSLIDLALHEPPTIDKLVWVAILLSLNVFGTFVYLVFRRPRRDATATSRPAANPSLQRRTPG